MPKKQARNAFYFYMKDLEPALRREGRVFPNGMADVVPIAHPRWKELPDIEKERYEKIAKEYKAKMRGVEGDKYRLDNVGNIIAERVDKKAIAEDRQVKEVKAVRENWPLGKDVRDETFYFINFQTLCKTVENEYLPCEVAAIEYSLQHGVTKKFHRFMEPGKIPTGYRFECKQKSEDYHQIPICGFELADPNYRGLWIQLENFVNPNGKKLEYPPFYCMGNDIEEVKYCLAWLHDKATLGIPNRLKKVYQLEQLAVELFAHIGISPSKSSCIDLLTATTWDYESETKCEYHENLECKYCALGIVQRYAFALSDSLCAKYDVKLTFKHIPVSSSVEDKLTIIPRPQSQNSRMGFTRGYTQPQNQALPPYAQQQQQQQKRMQGRPPLDSSSSDEDDNDDDEDPPHTTFRRPNMTAQAFKGYNPIRPTSGGISQNVWTRHPSPSVAMATHLGPGAGMNPAGVRPAQAPIRALSVVGRGSPTQALATVGIGRGAGLQCLATAGIGRGLSALKIDSADDNAKFAMRAGAPEPSSAPPPPTAWQTAVTPPTVTQKTNGPPSGTDISASESVALVRGENSLELLRRVRASGAGLIAQAKANQHLKLPKGRGRAPPTLELSSEQ